MNLSRIVHMHDKWRVLTSFCEYLPEKSFLNRNARISANTLTGPTGSLPMVLPQVHEGSGHSR